MGLGSRTAHVEPTPRLEIGYQKCEEEEKGVTWREGEEKKGCTCVEQAAANAEEGGEAKHALGAKARLEQPPFIEPGRHVVVEMPV